MRIGTDEHNFDAEYISKGFECAYKQHRDCFKDVMSYLTDESREQYKVCAIYGLRRTGKTTIMEQCIEMLPDKEKAVFITCNNTTNYWKIYDFIGESIDKGYKYIFIDEITYSDGFQEAGESLANVFVRHKNARIVITGTDSLGLALPTYNLQYDRTLMIHTSYIPFAEYSRITGIDSLDTYIEKGAVFEPDLLSDYYKTHRYVDTAISDNLINSLERSEGIDRYPAALSEIYEKYELKNAIERIINKYSQDLTAKAIRKEFKAGIIGTELTNIATSREKPDNIRVVLNYDKLNENIAEALGIIKNSELSVRVTEEHKKAIYDFLKDMDVFVSLPVLKSYNDKESGRNLEMITQPAIYHANIKHSINALRDSDNWLENATDQQKTRLIKGSYNVAYGNIMENIIISDVYHTLSDGNDVQIDDLFDSSSGRWYVSKLRQHINGKDYEADLIIYDKERKETYIFDVKHSSEYAPEQSLALEDNGFNKYIEKNFGKVAGKGILYNGVTLNEYDVPRISASRFLKVLYKEKKKEIISFADVMDHVYDHDYKEAFDDKEQGIKPSAVNKNDGSPGLSL